MLTAAVFVVLSGNAKASEFPFFATPDVPDYVASMIVWEKYGEPHTHPRSVFHHHGWTRVEEVKGNDRMIFYGRFADNAVLRTIKTGDEDFTWIRIQKAAKLQDRFGIVATRQTEDTGNQAGEPCKWWQIVRRGDRETPSPLLSFSCVSRDGIEVGAKNLSDNAPFDEIRLTSLERKPVSAS